MSPYCRKAAGTSGGSGVPVAPRKGPASVRGGGTVALGPAKFGFGGDRYEDAAYPS